MKTLNIHITGKVQGVWFRGTAQEEAEKLGINGWAKNELDGSVTILAQGEPNQLDALLDWCQQGSDAAHVENIEINEVADAPIEESFEVR